LPGRSGLNSFSYIKGIREYGMERRAQVNSLHGLARHSFCGAQACGDMVMSNRLRKIHIKTCLARIVMYSQRHVC